MRWEKHQFGPKVAQPNTLIPELGNRVDMRANGKNDPSNKIEGYLT